MITMQNVRKKYKDFELELLGEHFDARQIHDAEVVGLVPVEALAARDENLLLMKQVERELLVIGDVELLHVDLREDVERRLGLDHRDAVDLAERVVDEVALLADAAAGRHIALDALVAAEGRLHDGLRGHVGAQAHVRQHVDAQHEVACARGVARHDHPADAVARDHVRFRQARERHAEQVGRERCDGDVLFVVHDQAVVDLVREDHQAVAAGHFDDFFQHGARVHGAGGVVRGDDDDGLGARGDLAFHVGDVGVPIGLFVADVVHRRAARERGAGRPQRVIGRGNENLVAGIEQGLHAQVDELRNAVAGIDGVHVHVGNVLDLGVLHDGLARREQAARVGIALAIGQLVAHVLDHFVRRAEAERRRVADIELEDALALVLHTGGLVDDGTAHVIQDVIELGGFRKSTHGGAPCNLS